MQHHIDAFHLGSRSPCTLRDLEYLTGDVIHEQCLQHPEFDFADLVDVVRGVNFRGHDIDVTDSGPSTIVLLSRLHHRMFRQNPMFDSPSEMSIFMIMLMEKLTHQPRAFIHAVIHATTMLFVTLNPLGNVKVYMSCWKKVIANFGAKSGATHEMLLESIGV